MVSKAADDQGRENCKMTTVEEGYYFARVRPLQRSGIYDILIEI